jgi:hypothetical protein
VTRVAIDVVPANAAVIAGQFRRLPLRHRLEFRTGPVVGRSASRPASRSPT